MDREAGCGPLECCEGLRGGPGTIKVLLWLPRLYRMLWLLHSLGEDNHIAVIALHVFAKDHKGGFDAKMGWLRTIIML